MSREKDTESISNKHQSLMTGVNQSIIVPQKVALTSLDILEEQLQKWGIS